MPIPLLLAGLGIGAAALGIGGHMSAKETNERAQEISEDAQRLYNNARISLEDAQVKTEESLLELGYLKKKVLETSIKQFFVSYSRIKNLELRDSVGIEEIKNFTLEKQDELELREMVDVYESTFSSGAAGAATGAVIALAASGSLPVVTGTLSVASSAFIAGEFGIATGLAGSALSFGAAMTPLSAIAAPIILFSGISSSIKADENLEKAHVMYAEAEEAYEKMKISEDLCFAIAEKSDIFKDLLNELNILFSQCTSLLDAVTKKHMGIFKTREIDAKNLSDDEFKLIAATRALAGAVKAVIDTPILTEDGIISEESETIYDTTIEKLPLLTDTVNDIKNCDYNIKPIVYKTEKVKSKTPQSTVPNNLRNILAVIIGVFMFKHIQGVLMESIVLGILAFSITTLLIMDNKTESNLFKMLKNTCSLAIGIGFSIIFYKSCGYIVYMDHYIIGSVIAFIVSAFIFGTCLESNNSVKLTLAKVAGCMMFFAIAILLFAILFNFFGMSYTFAAIIVVIPYAFFTMVSTLGIQQ